MKKLILLIPLLLIGCKKESTSVSVESIDSARSASELIQKNKTVNQDSLIANSKVVAKVLDEGVNRNVDKNEIVRTADGSMLPFTVGDQFTTDDQKFILKLKNVSRSKLKITIETGKPMNLRINQIKKPDGSFDGPFGQTLILNTAKKGEYWIILGKNLMADGNGKGHFSLKIE